MIQVKTALCDLLSEKTQTVEIRFKYPTDCYNLFTGEQFKEVTTITKEMEPFMSGEYMVTDIKRAKIAELFESNDGLADRWFKCKVAFITLDEKTGAEKRANQMMMVQAIDLRDAIKSLDKAMEGTLGDYVIVSVAETAIMDVYRYKTAEDAQEQ